MFIKVLCLVCLESLDHLRKQTLGHLILFILAQTSLISDGLLFPRELFPYSEYRFMHLQSGILG